MPTSRQNLPPAEIDCKWWKQGYCFRGSTCYFRHDAALAGVDNPKYEANREKKEQRESDIGESTWTIVSIIPMKAHMLQVDSACKDGYSPSPSRGVSLDNSTEPSISIQEQCAICFQIPSTLGLLVNCDHVFCLSMRP
jgi:E3 ubiquitin-protein ligase makorin